MPALAAAMLGFAGMAAVRADALADFSGGLGDSAPNQFRGSGGQGWIGGWSTYFWGNLEQDFSFGVEKDAAFGEGADALRISRQAGGGFARLYRILDSATTDPAAAQVTTFKVRADEFDNVEDGQFRITVISAAQADEKSPSPANSMWCVVAGEEGTWRIYHGNEAGELQSVNTRVSFEPGVVYSVKVEADPGPRTFRVTLESVSDYFESPELLFPNRDPAALPELISFGGWVTENKPGEFRWSLGPVKIEGKK